MLFKPSLTDSSVPVREEDLKLPTLMVLAKAKQAKINGLTGGDLVSALESITVMADADREVTPGDRVSRFRRQALNLLSHGTLQREGLISARQSQKDRHQRFHITSKGRAALAQKFIATIGMPPAARPPVESSSRTLERAIAKPALFVLASLEMTIGAPVPMTTLRTALSNVLPQSEEDRAVLKNRKDTRMDQVIRNLISHNTLTKDGWVKRTDNNALTITPAGYSVVLDSLLRHVPTPPMFAKPVAPSLSEAVSRTQDTAPVATTEPESKIRPRAVARPR